MRVEIELAKLLFHFGKPVRVEPAPNQWRPAEQRRSVFVSSCHYNTCHRFVSPYTDS